MSLILLDDFRPKQKKHHTIKKGGSKINSKRGRPRKYATKEKSLKAKKEYKKEWDKKNKGSVSKYNKEYYKKSKKKI